MPYKLLRSLYYSDNKIYAKEYRERFNSEKAVKLDFFIGENQAFFMENEDVYKLAFLVEKLKCKVTKLNADNTM